MDFYKEDWNSIDSRPTPDWFKQAKFGIFVHWGVYSVPSFAPKRSEVDSTGGAYSEWYGWSVREKIDGYYRFHKKNYGDTAYEQFADSFKGEFFDAEKWIELFIKSGAKYLVAVTKHHDGYTLFDSEYSRGWSCTDRGVKRDVLKELYAACDKLGMVRGAYYSLMEWPSPVFTGEPYTAQRAEKYALEKMIPQMKELVEKYRPLVLYTDGEWDYSSEIWHSESFLSWLFNESSVRDKVVVNDRWGSDCRGVHGGYRTCEYGEVNSKAVSEEEAQRNLGKHYWEECRSIGNSFGYNRNEDIEDYLTGREVIELLVKTVSAGGNLCLNVGPSADGKIPPIIQERLLYIGRWLNVNGEAIYGANKGAINAQNGVYSTEKEGCIYNIFFGYRAGRRLFSTGGKRVKGVSMLGYGALPFSEEEDGVAVTLPYLAVDDLPCADAFTVKIELK